MSIDLPVAVRNEILGQGAAIAEIRQTEGFRIIARMIRERGREAAVKGLQDETRDVAYYRGYVAACESIVDDFDRLINNARVLRDELEADGDKVVGIRLGGESGGTLAGEDV